MKAYKLHLNQSIKAYIVKILRSTLRAFGAWNPSGEILYKAFPLMKKEKNQNSWDNKCNYQKDVEYFGYSLRS